MNKHEHAMIRRQSMLLTVTVLLLCIAAGSLRYYTLVTQTVYEESVSHLRELLHQTGTVLNGFVEHNMTYLHMRSISIQEIDEDEDIQQYLEKVERLEGIQNEEQQEWDFEYIHQKTRERRWFHIVAMRSEVEGRSKYIFVMSDRTEDKKVNQALEEAAHAAEAAWIKRKRCGIAVYEFRVKDNGIGMSPEFIKKIFDPFERERTSTVSRVPGTGLGMSISKNLVEMMGGTIEVQSEQGKGTEFMIRIPMRICSEKKSADHCSGEKRMDHDFGRPSADRREETFSPMTAGNDFSGRHVLLVEDNELNREIATAILRGYGFEVDIAENGAIAVEKVQSAAPDIYDIVLMDVLMPVMDGFLSKPIDIDELWKTLRRLLQD